MTKKDYELIADSIREFRYKAEELTGLEIDQQTISVLTGWLAHDLSKANERFDSEKFTSATL